MVISNVPGWRVAPLTLAAAILSASTSNPSAQSRPTEPITTDFLAMAADGRPIRDLKPEDLSIKVDGKTRTIRSLQLVAIGDAPGSGVKIDPVDTPPPDATNAVSRTGRGIMVGIDDESITIGGERPIATITRMAPSWRRPIASPSRPCRTAA